MLSKLWHLCIALIVTAFGVGMYWDKVAAYDDRVSSVEKITALHTTEIAVMDAQQKETHDEVHQIWQAMGLSRRSEANVR